MTDDADSVALHRLRTGHRLFPGDTEEILRYLDKRVTELDRVPASGTNQDIAAAEWTRRAGLTWKWHKRRRWYRRHRRW